MARLDALLDQLEKIAKTQIVTYGGRLVYLSYGDGFLVRFFKLAIFSAG